MLFLKGDFGGLNRDPRRRRGTVGEGEVELGRLASLGFEIRPVRCIDQRDRGTGSRSLIYSSPVAPEDGFALSGARPDRRTAPSEGQRFSSPLADCLRAEGFTPLSCANTTGYFTCYRHFSEYLLTPASKKSTPRVGIRLPLSPRARRFPAPSRK